MLRLLCAWDYNCFFLPLDNSGSTRDDFGSLSVPGNMNNQFLLKTLAELWVCGSSLDEDPARVWNLAG